MFDYVKLFTDINESFTYYLNTLILTQINQK